MNNIESVDVSKVIELSNLNWDDIQSKPEEYTPEYHTHAEYAKRYHRHNISDIIDVSEFATADHLHDNRYYTKEEVDAKIEEASAPCEVHWDDIVGIPEKFPSIEHTHHDEYYTKSEINAKLRRYALIDHRHAIDDIDGDFDFIPGDGSDTGGTSTKENYTKFLIHPEYFVEDDYGLFYCQVEHNFGTENIDIITKDLEGAFVLVDVNCLDENNIILTAMSNETIVLLARKITVK